jgi:hypothetical protein
MRRQDPAVQAASSETRREGRVWLPLARLVVIAATALAAVFFIASLGSYFDYVTVVCRSATCGNDQLQATTATQLAAVGVTLAAYGVYMIALQAIYMLTTLAVAALLVWRRPSDGFALFSAFTLVVWAFFVVDTPIVLANSNAAWGVVSALFALASFPCFTLYFLLFPAGRLVSARLRWLALGFAALTTLVFMGAALADGQTPLVAYLLFFLVWFGMLIGVQIHRYRYVSTPTQRQQTKWVVYGLVIALLGFMLILAVQVTVSESQIGLLTTILNGLYYPFELLVPLSIGIAILRSRLYDIDLLINRTLVYGSLTAVLLAIYLIGVVGTQGIVQGISGQATGDSPLVIVVTTLLVAALFQPLRRRMQGAIDRRFYRSKYDVTRMIADFSSTLRSEVNLDALTSELVATVEEAMHPAQVSLWLRVEHPVSMSRPQGVSQ